MDVQALNPRFSVSSRNLTTWQPGPVFASLLAAMLLAHSYLAAFPGGSIYIIPLLWLEAAAGIVWMASLLLSITAGGLFPLARFRRWAAIAIAVLAVALAIRLDVFVRLGFELSRPALEAAALESSASEDFHHRTLGLYPVDWITRGPNGATFYVSGAGFFNDDGFFWSTREGVTNDCAEGGWDHHLAGQWYVVSCSW
jgi:hypothetical protein